MNVNTNNGKTLTIDKCYSCGKKISSLFPLIVCNHCLASFEVKIPEPENPYTVLWVNRKLSIDSIYKAFNFFIPDFMGGSLSQQSVSIYYNVNKSPIIVIERVELDGEKVDLHSIPVHSKLRIENYYLLLDLQKRNLSR